MKTKLTMSILVFIILLISVSESEAHCSCGYITPDSEGIDVVFTGKLLKEPDEKEPDKYKVEVSEIFKGLEKEKTVEIYYSRGCGPVMIANKDYLFMAFRDEKIGKISVWSCAYSYENARHQQQMLEILRWKKNPQNQGGIIVGKVATGFWLYKETQKPAEVNKVFLETEQGAKFEAKIEENGLYKFTGLKKGIYKLYIELPKHLITSGDANDFEWGNIIRTNIKISGDEALIEDFKILTNGIISGQVLDENNLPVNSVNVNLYSTDNENQSIIKSTETDPSGNYSLKGILPGKYYISVGASEYYMDREGRNLEFPLTFFPNFLNKTEAEIITLEYAQVLQNKNIFLTKLKTRTVKGQLLMEDGSPAKNVKLSIKRQRKTGGRTIRNTNTIVAQTNSIGEFSIEIYEDSDYLINAMIWEHAGNYLINVLFSSKCFAIPKNGEVKPLNIVLKKGDESCDWRKVGF